MTEVQQVKPFKSYQIVRMGEELRIRDRQSFQSEDFLPPGNYDVKFDSRAGEFYLVEAERFTRPARIYGNVETLSNKFLATYIARNKNTGVLLYGEKGSGKSLQSRDVCIRAVEAGMPVLIVAAPYRGPMFHAFLASIQQRAVVFIDEMEKIYDSNQDADGDTASHDKENAQQGLLSLLDGGIGTNKLFLLTCNDAWRVDTHLHNRPGRVFYAIQYGGLSQAFLRQYLEENLVNQGAIDQTLMALLAYNPVSFDMISALVWEMNQYNSAPMEALSVLNIEAKYTKDSSWNVTVNRPDGSTVMFVKSPGSASRQFSSSAMVKCNPLTDVVVMKWWQAPAEGGEDAKPKARRPAPVEDPSDAAEVQRKVLFDVGAITTQDDGSLHAYQEDNISSPVCLVFSPKHLDLSRATSTGVEYTNEDGYTLRLEKTYNSYTA